MKYIVIHHTAVSRDKQKAQFYPVNRYHKEKWNSISELGYYTGYNYFIGTNGVCTQTRNIGEETIAVIGHNFDSIHICVAGDFDIELPTEAQKSTLRDLIDSLEATYPLINIKLHRELAENRNCPGKLFTHDYLNPVKNDIIDEQKKEILKLRKALDEARELYMQLLDFIIKKLT